MKCALELNLTKLKAEALAELKSAIADEEARREYETAKENAINFCDTKIDDKLISCANRCSPLKTFMTVTFFEDRLGNKLFKEIDLVKRKAYADGRDSYGAVGKTIAWDAFCEYLNLHCISAKIGGSTDYWHYGFGLCEGTTIVISAENCL